MLVDPPGVSVSGFRDEPTGLADGVQLFRPEQDVGLSLVP